MQDYLKTWIHAGSVQLSNLILHHYKDIGLTEDNLVTLLILKSHLDHGDPFPDSNHIARAMQVDNDEAFKLIHQLIKKNVLEINTQTDADGKTQDIYSLNPLYERLVIYLKQQEQKMVEEEDGVEEAQLYQMFEAEFGRPLSPIEIQTLSAWIDDDKYTPELIHMALKQAVLSQVYSLRYIDRILLNWQRKNITTKEQVLKEQQKFQDAREHMPGNNNKSAPKVDVPLYDWLEDNDDND